MKGFFYLRTKDDRRLPMPRKYVDTGRPFRLILAVATEAAREAERDKEVVLLLGLADFLRMALDGGGGEGATAIIGCGGGEVAALGGGNGDVEGDIMMLSACSSPRAKRVCWPLTFLAAGSVRPGSAGLHSYTGALKKRSSPDSLSARGKERMFACAFSILPLLHCPRSAQAN